MLPAQDNYRLVSGFEFSVLGSGSSGNASLVRSPGTAILVDAGMSCRQIVRRLAAVGQTPEKLDGILLTHEHSDHTKALGVFCRSYPEVPIYASAATRRVVGENLGAAADWRIIPKNAGFELGEFGVTSFPVPHDAVDPLGFVLRTGAVALGILTDAGHVTKTIRHHLGGCHALFIETNYDPALLEADHHRPWQVKQRILGPHGHLSNQQATALVRELVLEDAESELEFLVCGHLSSDCNTPEKVSAQVAEALGQRESAVGVCISERAEPTPLLRIAGRAGGAEAGAGEGRAREAGGLSGSPAARVREPLGVVAQQPVQGDLFDAC